MIFTALAPRWESKVQSVSGDTRDGRALCYVSVPLALFSGLD